MNFKKEDETMKQFEMYELTIKGEEPQGSQALVDVTAEFTAAAQTTKESRAFMPGWKLQGALLPKSGRHLYLSCERSDAGRGQSGMSAE